MFKHILLPTDGSKLADRAIIHGMNLAKALGAKVTLLSVVPEFRMIADESFAMPMSMQAKQRYEKEATVLAEKKLAAISVRVSKAGLQSKMRCGGNGLSWTPRTDRPVAWQRDHESTHSQQNSGTCRSLIKAKPLQWPIRHQQPRQQP
jgi:nucleotide-binding universal stress UspA family protein